MRGAITGDIIGSAYEFNNIKTKDFVLFISKTKYTDDTVLTIAVADAILQARRAQSAETKRSTSKISVADSPLHDIPYEQSFLKWCVPRPDRGYGGKFFKWLVARDEDRKPYNSLGNGAAMRISPVGWLFDTEEDVLREAKRCCDVTHNHPEGVKAGQAVAMAVFMARMGKSKDDIRTYVEEKFGYDLGRTVDEIRPEYRFSEKSPESVPEAIICFLESASMEDAIRNAVSLGGDADTQANIAGGIAEAFYGLDERLWEKAKGYLDEEMLGVVGGNFLS
jgi:ADP-ribosylglycohydrolase